MNYINYTSPCFHVCQPKSTVLTQYKNNFLNIHRLFFHNITSILKSWFKLSFKEVMKFFDPLSLSLSPPFFVFCLIFFNKKRERTNPENDVLDDCKSQERSLFILFNVLSIIPIVFIRYIILPLICL